MRAYVFGCSLCLAFGVLYYATSSKWTILRKVPDDQVQRLYIEFNCDNERDCWECRQIASEQRRRKALGWLVRR